MGRLLVLVLALAATNALELNVSKSNEQAADGSTSFTYFSQKTKEAAESFLQYGKEVQDALADYTEALKKTNNASLTLERYKEAVQSVEGTSCEVNEETKHELSGAQIVIEAIITSCAEGVPADYKETLNEQIKEYLKKVQEIDNNLRLTSSVCSSLRATPPPSCVEAEDKALASLEELQSTREKAKLSYYSRTAYFASKQSIDVCVHAATTTLREDLNSKIEEIEACKSLLQ